MTRSSLNRCGVLRAGDSCANLEDLKWLHQQLCDQIDREFDLLGNRMTWLLTGNAFLFTVIAISIGTLTNVAIANQCTETFKLGLITIVPVFLVGCSVLGIFVSSISWFSMTAARNIIASRKEDRRRIEKRLGGLIGFDFPITVERNDKHFFGNLPYMIMPGAIATIWLMVLSYVLFGKSFIEHIPLIST